MTPRKKSASPPSAAADPAMFLVPYKKSATRWLKLLIAPNLLEDHAERFVAAVKGLPAGEIGELLQWFGARLAEDHGEDFDRALLRWKRFEAALECIEVVAGVALTVRHEHDRVVARAVGR